MSSEPAPKPETRLMAETIRRVSANAKPGVNRYSSWLASVRQGITPSGELFASAQAAPFLAGLPQYRHSPAIRAAAIRAINKDVPHTSERSLGASLGRLARVEGGTSIEDQVSALPLMNTDAAALVLDGLVGRCARSGIAVNFYDLARTLIFWGNGAGASAAQRRNQLVFDFYDTSNRG